MTLEEHVDGVGREVVGALLVSGHEAYWEHPGYINLLLEDGQSWAIGTADGTWAGNLCDEDGNAVQPSQAFDTQIAEESTDVREIVAAILKATEAAR